MWKLFKCKISDLTCFFVCRKRDSTPYTAEYKSCKAWMNFLGVGGSLQLTIPIRNWKLLHWHWASIDKYLVPCLILLINYCSRRSLIGWKECVYISKYLLFVTGRSYCFLWTWSGLQGPLLWHERASVLGTLGLILSLLYQLLLSVLPLFLR